MSATPFDAILDRSRSLLSERLGEAVAAMLERADATLAELIDKTQDAEAQGTLMAGRDVALRQREAIEREFQERYSKAFAKHVRKIKRGLNTRQIAGDATGAFEIELELVGEQDLEETLRYNKLATRIRQHCAEGLGALDQRAAVMLGDGNLQADDNPFGTQVLCDAFKQACREVEADAGVRATLMHLFDEQMLDDLHAGYDDVNELLVENSILPRIRYTVVKKERGSRKGADGDDAAEESAGPAEPALPDDLFGALQKMLGGTVMPGAAGLGVGGVPMVQGAELLSSLTQIQLGNLAAMASGATNVLHGLKQTSVGASMGQMDAMTLNVVSLLFDQLFDDPKVPAGVKALAARLQIPILKVAIADKTLFSDKAHPAREHLDLLGEFAVRLPGDFDEKHPLYPKLEPIELEIVEKFRDKVDVFAAANEKLRALVAEEDQRAAQATQLEAKRLEQLENLSAGRSAAQEEIRARLREHHPGQAVRDFLVQQWIKVLLVVHAQAGKETPAWTQTLGTMDLLLWSVEPKPSTAEQRKLSSQVPALLKALTTGLNSVGVEDSVRTAFYSELMKLHTKMIAFEARPRAASDGSGTHLQAPASPTTSMTRVPGTITATRSPVAADAKPGAAGVAAKETDDALDFTAEITVKNPFGGGEVKVDEFDFTDAPAAQAQAAAPRAAATGAGPAPKKPAKDTALPSKLKEGAWVGIRAPGPDEPRQPAKLLYMSPLKTRFLFCDRAGKTVLECNRTELARRFRLRDLVILKGSPDASLFERIFRGVMSKLGAA
ncbi:MAG: DUF1631 family protein [Usitatibacter sp.]